MSKQFVLSLTFLEEIFTKQSEYIIIYNNTIWIEYIIA